MATAPASPSHVVIITGGSSGIGLATARLFAKRGWRVGLIARGEAGLKAAAERIRAEGGRVEGGWVETAAADVADRAALAAAATSIMDKLGPVEIWINDAGAAMVGPFTETSEDEFRRVIDTTFMGQVNGTRVALAAMTPRGRGTIVAIGSEVSFRAMPLMSEHSPIHIGLVHPPAINSPFFAHAGAHLPDGEVPSPVPPYYQPELIAEAVWLVASERRRELKVTGATVGMALANAVMPSVLDQVLARIGHGMQVTRRRDAAAARDPAVLSAGQRAPRVHGVFGDRVMTSSAQMWVARNRYTIGLSAIGLMWATRRRRRRRS